MTPEEAFEVMKPRYDAVEEEKLRRPTTGPVADLCDEYSRLYKVGAEDKPLFEKLAQSELFDIDNVMMLATAAGGLSHAEARWTAYGNPGKSPELVAKMTRIEEIRGIQLMDMGFVDRRHSPPGLDKTLSDIREGSSKSDTLADVLALGQLGDRFAEELKNVGHLTAIDKEGEALCAELRNFIDVDSDKIAEIKEMRDRAYTVATTMYEETREGGRFIFRNNPERIAEYRNLTSK